ncbi:MAG: S1 RNA-binding domain-containing protein [Pirellulales bacterium]|nr:S1 RNA-binding domain-containing protein [Pirellulales bacterium]
MTTDPMSSPENDPSEAMKPETPLESESPSQDTGSDSPSAKPRILIGSQRAGNTPAKPRDWYVPGEEKPTPSAEPAAAAPDTPEAPAATRSAPIESPPAAEAPIAQVAPPPAVETPTTAVEPATEPPVGEPRHFPPPNIREQLSPDLESELDEALGDASLDELMGAGSDAITSAVILEPETKHQGRIVAIARDNVFVELGSREQGTVSLKQFAEAPEVGAEIEVVVTRLNPAEGLYELRLPGAAANVADWTDLDEGVVVDAMVTGHNTGGLECEVNHIRGFIPVSQISLYRVEDLAEFVGQKMSCIVTEANPERRNLVLSRRAVLEREREESRQQLLRSLAPGQVHEGVVRKLMDFGAFVDLGGVDGLLHISQLGWGRVNHPGDVLAEGQAIKVKVLKIDHGSRRISLGYRDQLANPWDGVEQKFPVNTVAHGKVVKIMEFGAFVELEPGVEGLVHISELDHKRVQRVGNVVSEGQEVDVLVKSIDREKQRISLSIKDTLPQVDTDAQGEATDEQLDAAMPKPSKPRSNKPLRGGLGRVPGADRFGLNW